MRRGAYECALVPGTFASAVYDTPTGFERHRHRYEFNKRYEKQFEEAGVVFSGRWPEKGLVEIMELPDHPWFVGCQFHPEFRSRPGHPHPLFHGFVGAAMKLAGGSDGEASPASAGEAQSVGVGETK